MAKDYFGFPVPETAEVQQFTCTGVGTGATLSYQAWNKPKGKTMAYIMLIGGGGGGGGGMTGATSSIRGGGGGGGSGAIARLLIPLFALPDVLYFQVGSGGLGGTATNNGASGIRTWVSITNNSGANQNLLLISGAAGAGGGTAGSVAGSAAAGAAETITGQSVLAIMGIASFIAGKIGAIGGVVGGGVGASNTVGSFHFLNGGAGGGTTPAANTDFAGGDQTGVGVFPTVVGGPAGGASNGPGGYIFPGPWLSYGGTGGGTAQGQAGNGGNGAIGSGGGGGGGGITGGTGGKGGDGYALIICY